MDSMDLDVDMEVDVDLVPDEPIVPEAYTEDLARSPGEVPEDPDTPAPTKVYIRGLDVLNPKDVKAYVAEHFPDSTFNRIEWIDDSSANLLFSTESTATQALTALCAEANIDIENLPLRELVPAKPFSQKPEVLLQVRKAVASDRKTQGAASRSRFYLLNPEYDPEERARRRESRRYRDRDGDDHGRRRRTREDEPRDNFDVNLYDDDEAALATRAPRSGNARRRRSYTPESDCEDRRRDSYRPDNRGKELFPLGDDSQSRRSNGASRNRSRSPLRDRDGDRDMEEFSSEASAARNRDRARSIKSHMHRGNNSKELFPSMDKGDGRLGDKVETTADLVAKGISLPLMDGSSDVPANLRAPASKRLEDRISAPGQSRLADRISNPADSSAFNIRGAASRENTEQGFSIKGMGKSAKELFPDKFGGSGNGNEGKELFGDRSDGRTRHRKKAGDLFD